MCHSGIKVKIPENPSITFFEYIRYIFCKFSMDKQNLSTINDTYSKIGDVKKLMDLTYIIPNVMKIKDIESLLKEKQANQNTNMLKIANK